MQFYSMSEVLISVLIIDLNSQARFSLLTHLFKKKITPMDK